MGRYLGIDFGTKRIGLALSDPLHMTAQPFKTVRNRPDCLQEIADVIRQQEIEKIIIGYPFTLKGEKGKSAVRVNGFTDALSRLTAVPIIKCDERFTTTMAHRALHDAGKKTGHEKEKIDMIAAALILQHFLDISQRPGKDTR